MTLSELTELLAQEKNAEIRVAYVSAEARYNGVVEIDVQEVTRPTDLKRRFCVIEQRLVPDATGDHLVRSMQVHNGFDTLTRSAELFLAEKHPDKIPASVLALDPDDPMHALRLYRASLREAR